MKMKIYGQVIDMDDKSVEAYNMVSELHPLDTGRMEFLIEIYRSDIVDGVANMGERKLTKIANEVLLHELEEIEMLSRPETTQKAIEFYKNMKEHK